MKRTIGYTIGASKLRLGLHYQRRDPARSLPCVVCGRLDGWHVSLVYATGHERRDIAVWRTRADAIKAWRATQKRAGFVVRRVVKKESNDGR